MKRQKEAIARMEIEYELRNNIKYKEFFAGIPAGRCGRIY